MGRGGNIKRNGPRKFGGRDVECGLFTALLGGRGPRTFRSGVSYLHSSYTFYGAGWVVDEELALIDVSFPSSMCHRSSVVGGVVSGS
jgi:hypothetical protein